MALIARVRLVMAAVGVGAVSVAAGLVIGTPVRALELPLRGQGMPTCSGRLHVTPRFDGHAVRGAQVEGAVPGDCAGAIVSIAALDEEGQAVTSGTIEADKGLPVSLEFDGPISVAALARMQTSLRIGERALSDP